MNLTCKIIRQRVAQALFICLALGQLAQTARAASTDLSNVPMAVNNSVTPNVLVILDNSESMDGYMAGTLVSGSDPATRGNVGRSAMRNLAITPYRTAFNWGLMSFTTGSPSLMGTYVYYLGDAAGGTATTGGAATSGMNFTTSCPGYVAPVGTYPNATPAIPGNTGTCTTTTTGNCTRSTNGAIWTQNSSSTGGTYTWHDSPDTTAIWTGNRCVANPQPVTSGGNTYNYISIDYSSDDYNINDVLYNGPYSSTPAISQAWAPAANTSSTTTYDWYLGRSATGLADTTWNDPADFTSLWFSSTLTPTDAGYIPKNSGSSLPNDISRSLYLPRAWGYYAGVTGSGTLNEAVKPDSTTHYNNLLALLGNETNSATGEIKNAAVFTPTVGTLTSAGTYYSGSSTPITASCQQNFVMLVTDGLPTANTSGSMYSAAARTNTCSTTTTGNCSRDNTTATWTYGSGTATATWADATSATWTFGAAVTDVTTQLANLRTTALSGWSTSCSTSSPPAAPACSTHIDGTQTAGAIPTGKYDIQTYVVGLGDTVVNVNNFAALNAMAYSGGGTNTALLATDSTSFNTAINTITSNITAKVGSSAAIAVANALVTSTDNASYASSYNSGTWTGDLNAYAINITTGLPSTTSLWTAGSAQTQLDLRTSATRQIATSVGTAGTIGGIQFQATTASTATKLSTSQQTLLNSPTTPPGPSDGAAVVAYLRGDRSGEAAGTYRARAHLLGDTVNAEPLLVRAPSYNYSDVGYQGSSTTFKEANAGRARMVYQGANDGMLHAFNAATGAEAWAYIPNLVMSKLNNLSSKAGFIHTYLVDGSPISGDVDFKNCCETGSGNDWRTILVGGLGKGGRGYYALDVTNPIASSEAAVASKVLWEFPNSVTSSTLRSSAILNTGYSFGKPIIVKTVAKGWVVLVTSGYNNGTNAGDSGGDGLGHLYVLNPMTGDLIADIPTTGCTTTPTSSPCGLAQISAYVENGNVDDTTDFVYGGDLMGNVWRFNLSGNSVSSWSVAKFAVLRDAGSATQPVTTAPELAKIVINSIAYRFVYVGTGQYLGNSDVPGTGQNSHATQTQTMYGLVDTTTSALPDPLRPSLVQQTLSGSPLQASSTPVNFATQNGWLLDLPNAGERINTDPVLALGALDFTTNIPSSTICVPGGSSWFYSLDYKSGGNITGAAWSAISLGNALASRPVMVQLPSGQVVALIRNSNGTTIAQNAPTPAGMSSQKRVSWREIAQ